MPPPPTPTPAEPAADEAVAWQIDVSVLGNRFLRGGIIKGCLVTTLLSALLLGGIIGLASGELVPALQAAGLAVAGVFLLFGVGLLGFLVLVGFHQPIAYRLDGNGVAMLNASRVAKGIHRTAIIAGILTGKPAAAIAGISAQASETRFCAWNEARTVEDYPAELTMVVRGGMLSTIQVFCTPENYAQVRDFIFARTSHASRR